jgi:uncharacterized protein (DUF4213/DUF364 family)
MSIVQRLVSFVRTACENRAVPSVARLYRPNENIPDRRDKKFGVLMLSDGSCGFFYAGFDDTKTALRTMDLKAFEGVDTIALIGQCLSDEPLQRALGFGALNAVSQHLWRSAGTKLDQATDPVGHLDVGNAAHVGMVGFFPPLVKRFAAATTRLTVIEKDPDLLTRTGAFKMSADVAALADCDRVLITGSTLINHTLDDVLDQCSPKAQVALIGPTASCLPDPLFERGINVIGSITVNDSVLLDELLTNGQPWDAATRKYCLRSDAYPGSHSLLNQSCA